MSDHLLLIDASGFVHRAYHAGSAQFRDDGLPIWAVTGFLGMLWRLLGAAQADPPTHAAAIFDHGGKTFRHALFPAYKNNRPARALELEAQMPYMQHAAETMGVKPLSLAGFEADDIIATLATKARTIAVRTTIVSSDKDFCQLVEDGRIEIIEPVKQARIREADVRGRKFGVSPSQVPDVQALAGDPVDNIPGIDGIGLIQAAQMVRQFGTIEGVVMGVSQRPSFFTPNQRRVLRGSLQTLRLYRELAVLRRDVPVQIGFDELAVQPIMREHAEKLLETLGARHRFHAIFSDGSMQQRSVEKEPDPYAWWREELVALGQPVPDLPQCGYYLTRMVRKGPLVPARIWRESETDFISERPTGRDILRCEVATRPADAFVEWPKLARLPVSKAKFDFEIADGQWCREFAPQEPKAKPGAAIDILAARAPHCPPAEKRRRA